MCVSGARTIPTWYDKQIIGSMFYVFTEHESGEQITSKFPESGAVSAALSLTPFTVFSY